MSKETMLSYPKGMRFRPTDSELVDYFLHDKADVDRQGCFSSLVHQCNDFYGEREPWVLWDMYGGSTYEEGELMYFYTKRIKQNLNSTRFARKVGTGTWSGEYSKDVLDPEDGKTKIGTMRNFRYEKGCDSVQNGKWLMHEYQSKFENEESAYVICGLRRNPRKVTLQSDETNTGITKKNSVKDKKRKAKSDDVVGHQPKRLRKKTKEEEVYEVDQGSEPTKIEEVERKEEPCNEQGGSSCYLQPNCHTYYPGFPDYNYQDHNYPPYYEFPEVLGNNFDDGISIDDLLTTFPDDSEYCKSGTIQYQDQLYHGDNGSFNPAYFSNGGVSQMPNDQHTVDFQLGNNQHTVDIKCQSNC